MRLSLAKEADKSKSSASGANDNYTPGFGFKVLRDRVPSSNLVAIWGVNGYPSWNFFDENFPASNHIPGASGFALTTVAAKFASATDIV